MKDTVINILVQDGGYKRVFGPLRIVDTDFAGDFDAVLVGPGDQSCLVLIIDGDHISPAVAIRRVRSFALVLDRSGSQRPLTVVLIARQIEPFERLERLCRVFIITPMDDPHVALRGLLPLRILKRGPTLNAAEAALAEHLGKDGEGALIALLQHAANKGSSEVTDVILRTIAGAIEEPENRRQK